MRILILGGNGMIGHKMYQIISKANPDTWVTLRNKLNSYTYSAFYNPEKVIESIDLTNFEKLLNQLNTIKPDVIINACGITIRRGVNQLKSNSILLNSALPHFLNEWVTRNNKRLIHFSTDCVFSGIKGDYEDNDITEANDIYGLTKSMGEVIDSTFTITLRGSMIGRELENKTELFEWFLNQHNITINGFSKVIYSGITTIKMAEIVLIIIYKFPNLSGLFNVSSKSISKFELLTLCNDYFKVGAFIKNDNSYASNKNLISNKLFNELNMVQPVWSDLIKQLAQDCSENKNLYI